MKGSRLTSQQISIFTVMIYLGLSFIKPLAGIFSLYIYVNISFIRSLCGCFLLYILTYLFHSISGWGYITIYLHISCSEPLGGGFSYIYTLKCHIQWVTGWGFLTIGYILTFHLQWATGWGFLAIPGIYRYFTFSEALDGGFTLYTLIFHLQWASGWVFLAIYTDISPSVSIWVGVSRYIHWHFTFSEHLGGGFSLYTLTFHLQWPTGWGFLAIYTDISPSVRIWVGVSRYIQICQLLSATGLWFLAIYTDISPSVSHWVGVSRYIHRYFTFSEHLGGGFLLYIQIFHLLSATGWGFLAIYTDISHSVSHWVGVSCYIYRYFTFCQPLGGGFSLYILTFHLQWVTGWWFLAIYTVISSSVSHWVGVSRYIYTDISPSVSIWVGVSRHIYCYFIFSESLGGGFSQYILLFHLQWVTGWGFLAIYTAISSTVSHWVGVSRYIYTDISPQWASGWGFLAIYTDISPSVSIWVGVSRYIHWYFTFSEHLGGGFSLYTLTFHLQWASGWGFLAIYTDISPSVSIWVGVSRYIHWYFTFSEHLGGGFSLYILIFHLQWASGWGFLAIYTDISPSVSIWVGVSRYIHWHFTFSEHLGGGFSLYTLTFHLQWASGWGFLAIYTDISPSVSHWVVVSRYIYWHFTFSESLGWGFSLYSLIFHLQWASGWGFLAIYTDISPSVSIWVGVSCYIYRYFTFCQPLGGGFSLYILTFHLQWVTGWGFLAIYTAISSSVSHWVGVSRYIYTDISPSVSHWVGVSRHIYCYFIFSESLGGGFSLYIHWHFTSVSIWVGVSRYINWYFTFSEHLGGGFSLYTLIFHLQWASGWEFLAIYTDILPSVSIWVGVSRYIHWYFTFSEHLGGGFSLYTLIFHLQWASGWGFLAIYTDISPSVSIWVGVSRYIHWYFTFSEHLGGGFSLYILIFHLQWASGWGFLAIYTDISPSVSIWVGVSRYIHWHFTFSEHLGGGFSLYTLTFHLQWASGWGFLAIYTDISPSVSHWVVVSRYIYWHFTFSESLGWGFSLYSLIFHLQWASGWGFLAIYTDISPSVSIWVGVSRYIHWHFTFSEHLGGGFSLYTLTFHLQWASGWGFLAIYTDISPSVSHWVVVSRYIYWHFTFSESLGWGFSLYSLIFHLQWASGWGFLAIYTDISPSVSIWVGVSCYIYRYFTFCQPLGGGFSLYILTFHLQWVTGWGFLAIYTAISSSVSHWVGVSRYIYTDISPSVSHWVGVSRHIYCYFIFSESLGGGFSLYIHWHFTSVSIWVGVSRYINWYFTFSEHLGGGFSLYTLIFHLQWASGWVFLAIYTDILPSVSIWVGVSRYIHWYFTFSEHLGGGFSLYTLIFHLQWASGWGFLAIYTDISPSVSIWVGVSRYIHWYFTFSEHLGGGFSLYTLTFHLQWASGWGFLAIYTDISPSVSIWVGVSRYIHWHFTFSEHLGGGFSLYTLIFHLQWVSGWGILGTYTDISPSVSIWVEVSRYIHWHFTFSEHLGGGFLLYIQIFHLLSATGWWFLAIYTDISPSVSHWVGVSRYIHWYVTFSEHLGGGFSLYIQIFHLQWASGWGFLAIYTDISHSVSHWVGVSRYTFWHFTFSESLGGGFSPYILLFHLQWVTGWEFLAIYTLTFHLQWVTGWVFLAIYTAISSSVSHWVGVSRYIYTDISPQWASGWGFLAI